MIANSDPAPSRSRWELITLGCMFTGYMAFIFSRTALPVASPEMVKDLSLGLDEASYGDIAAWGTAGMITGKLLTGVIADWLGGRRVFLVALVVSALLTFAFGWGSSETIFAGLNFVMLFAVAASWPAMAGQLAATANSITKFKPAKMVSELPQPKAKVRSAETTRATRNTLRPPSQSAITPVRSFPVIMPAVPQAAISP